MFSTLHTNDAPSAITRMMERGVPAYLINATLLDVLARRLVCTLCKQPDAMADGMRPLRLAEGLTTLDEVSAARPLLD